MNILNKDIHNPNNIHNDLITHQYVMLYHTTSMIAPINNTNHIRTINIAINPL